ncbi:hypothetical protein SERLA73DRAFT_178306 [Serpula lacrymans var. lacrymans S7.3]|uniref:Uncharacterized protein n=2 Tax=Serpula lacrymans var. lacrymans TaxID=341189 RepID=F8PR97_SERL3|nr:uncharacterized protein SERLADRAFT_462637 [Serpula lacrymans var. lacrymans S7.9]EGO02388.1 hypothetical protein SERLA73DRAFT_178306 [Serpula lacrymans var. lacrymans S7.3]EGO28115.1 hypothetical protein SERLADRAFT_462637 [Serpula lacrymans var. lacrymans S7.9]
MTQPTSRPSASTSAKRTHPLPIPPRVHALRAQPRTPVQYTDRIAILQFLSRPVPALSHLLPLFLSLGINNQARLDSMAEWPRVEVEKFIAKLVNANKLDAFEGKVIEMTLSGLLIEEPV